MKVAARLSSHSFFLSTRLSCRIADTAHDLIYGLIFLGIVLKFLFL